MQLMSQSFDSARRDPRYPAGKLDGWLLDQRTGTLCVFMLESSHRKFLVIGRASIEMRQKRARGF
jgi:hypothetical protein